MGLFKTRRSDYAERETAAGSGLFLERGRFETFSPSILGLGELSQPSRDVEAVCAIFDLAGFTVFSRQVDPHLAVPQFMTVFLDWLFEKIREQSTLAPWEDGLLLYSRLPFFAKFMGDGVMFLWDVRGMPADGLMNIAPMLGNITKRYRSEFLPRVRRVVSEPPSVLRVGLARGKVYSVGNGSDFVGPSINLAARLQKLVPSLTFCCSGRGFSFESYEHEQTREILTLKLAAVRGIGENELVYIRQSEFDALPDEERRMLNDPADIRA